jgi:hypothetical protein
MRRSATTAALLTLMTLSSGTQAQTNSEQSYWLLARDDGHTWCGYKNMSEFTSDVNKQMPTQSARVTYLAGQPTEFTYQVAPESGDWVVVDRYTLSKDGMILRRANLLAQKNLQIVQETTIHDGKIEPFRVITVTTLDGKKTDSSNTDLPAVSVRTRLSEIPFVAVTTEMQSRFIAKLCKTFE